PTPVDVSSDSAGKAGTGRDQGSGGSREQENQSRIAPAGSAGDEDEMKPEAATGEHGSETGLTVEAASGTDAASRQSATVSEPGPGEALAPADKAAAPVQVQEDVSREAPPPAATASAGPDPVPSETVAATTTAPLPARQVDTSRNATRAATAKVSEASPSGSAVGQDSPIVAGQTPLAVATAEPAPSTSTPRPARQAANPQKTASGQSAKVKEADLPGDSAGQSPPSVGGNIRPAMPQGERPSPEEFPRDTTPTEPARTAKQKPPGKAGKADDGGRNPSPGGGYPGQLGGSRELVSDLRSLMGADDSPKKAPSSGKVLKYYQLPSSIRDSLPKLSMSMLLHSKKSEERWVNINGAKVREGQEIASGLKVEEITPDGAIFTYTGQRFYKAVIGD
ncbi:MAG: general secretion pathway protein GspB, partial [Syntrophobacter sp.]